MRAYLVCAVLLLVACSDSSAPRKTVTTERIFYTCRANGSAQTDICSVNAQGTDRQVVIHGSANLDAAAVSPDGTKLVYNSAVGSEWSVWTANVDGTGARQVVAIGRFPTWDPTGTSIMYSNLGLYSRNPDGSQPGQILADSFQVQRAMWASNHDRIIASTKNGITAYDRLENLIYTFFNSTATQGAISPDRTRTALVFDNSTIYSLDMVGVDDHPLQGAPFVSWPAWSPSGDSIVYVVGDASPRLWIMTKSGTGAHQLTGEVDAAQTRPFWAKVTLP